MALLDRAVGRGAHGRHRLLLLSLLPALLLLGTCAPTPDRTGPHGAAGIAAYEYSEPLFVFAVVADTHVPDSRTFPPGDNYLHLKALSIADALLANCVEDINNHYPVVDFTVVLGDISDEGSAWELERAADILDNLDAPYYPVVGNHDNFQSDDKQAWRDAFGRDSTHYTFRHGGFNFIVIDPTLDPFEPPDRVVLFGDGIREYVRAVLDAEPEAPTILFNHYPLLNRCWDASFRIYQEAGLNCLASSAEPIQEDADSERRGYPPLVGEPYYRVYEGGRELRTVLENHGNVVAAVNGHVHANRREVLNGITYIDIGATLVGKPSIRYFYAYEHHIEVDFEYISNDTLLTHVQSMCPRCRRCTHPNQVCRFINGDLDSRRFTISY
jgi:predicted phosphodiesterase